MNGEEPLYTIDTYNLSGDSLENKYQADLGAVTYRIDDNDHSIKMNAMIIVRDTSEHNIPVDIKFGGFDQNPTVSSAVLASQNCSIDCHDTKIFYDQILFVNASLNNDLHGHTTDFSEGFIAYLDVIK